MILQAHYNGDNWQLLHRTEIWGQKVQEIIL